MEEIAILANVSIEGSGESSNSSSSGSSGKSETKKENRKKRSLSGRDENDAEEKGGKKENEGVEKKKQKEEEDKLKSPLLKASKKNRKKKKKKTDVVEEQEKVEEEESSDSKNKKKKKHTSSDADNETGTQGDARSKLENILFTKELQRRADAAGKKITTVSLHPGAVRTDLPRYIIGEDKFISMQDATPKLVDELKVLPAMYFTKGVDRGASSQIYLSSFQERDDQIAGKFFFNMKETKLGPAAMDQEKAKELWKVSEEMSGVRYKF